MNKSISLLLGIALVSACSSTDTASTAKEPFEASTETNLTYGTETNSIGSVVFTTENRYGVEHRVEFFIDQLPFHGIYDLCEKTGTYKFPETVVIDQAGNKTPIYKPSKVDCKSELSIKKFNKKYLMDYDMKLLYGYRIAQNQGFKAKLSVTAEHSSSGGLFSDVAVDNGLSKQNDFKLVVPLSSWIHKAKNH